MNEKESSKRTKTDEQVTETSEKTQSSGLSLMRREALALLGIGGLGALTSGSVAAQSRGNGRGTPPVYNWQEDVDANGHALSELGSLSMSANATSIQDFTGENLSIKDGVLTAAGGSGQSGSGTDQGPWYDHNVNTTTELKETPIPTAAIEVVSPDETETAVVAYRDGTQKHVYDGSAYTTIEQSRDGGQSFSKTATIKLSSTIDPCRTGNGLIAVDDTTLYFFDSQVDPRTQSNEATAVHRLDWDSSSKEWNVTTNLNRYKNYRILPHFVEEGKIKIGYVDFTVNPQVVQFAEYDPSSRQLTNLGIINEQPIRPNEHIVQSRKDGTLVAIVRCEAPDIEGTSPPAEQWSTSNDDGKTWTNHGFIEQTLHPLSDSYGATKGGQMIDTPYGERLVFLYRWSRGDDQETVLGLFNPYNGTVEQNIIISTVVSNEGANGGLRLVEDGAFGWRFYVVHEQGKAFDEGPGSGIFFRDLTLFQPAIYLGRYLGGESSGDERESTPTPNPAAAGRRENTWVSVSKAGAQVGGRAYLGSEQDISVDSTEQIHVDSVEFADGIAFNQENNAFVVRESGIYEINAAIAYVQMAPDALVQSRVHLADNVGSIGNNNKRAIGYFAADEDDSLGIAGSVVTTTEKLSKGNAITLFAKYT
jgi:hypothetical protein